MRARKQLLLAVSGLVLVLTGLTGCAFFPQGAIVNVPERPVIDKEKFHYFTLTNGLEVTLLEDHRLPRVAMGILLRRGVAIEPLQQAGVGALMADVMEQGAGNRDAFALAKAVDSLGASFSVSMGWDSTSVGVGGLSRDTGTLLGILRDVALAPRFDPAEVERAREEQLARLARAKDDPHTLVRLNYARSLYPDHRYGVSKRGTVETVSPLDRSALRAFYQRIFVAKDAIFFASGDFDPEALRTSIEDLFGDWKAGEIPPAVVPPPALVPKKRKLIVVDRPELVQAQILLGHEGLARTDERRIAANLMNGILGGNGFSSRLMKKIRSEEGLTYGIYSGIAYRRRPGSFQVGTSTRVPEVRRVIDLILAELARMKTEPPDEDEIEKAKNYAVGQFALGLETTDAVLGAQVNVELYGLPEDSLNTFRNRVRAVSVKEVAELADRLLHPERVSIVVVGPAEKIVPQLEDLGAVQVVIP